MPQVSPATEHAYQRLLDLEGRRTDFHFDSEGVLTLGSGYTPIIKTGSKWEKRDNDSTDLAAAGITLDEKQNIAIAKIAREMNKPGGGDKAVKEAALKDLSGIKISERQNRDLIMPHIDAAEKEARRHLGADVYDKLDPKRQAEMAVAAFNSPKRLKDAAPDLAKHAQAGDFEGMAKSFGQIGDQFKDNGVKARYKSGAAILRDPGLTGKLMVRDGDSLDGLARKHGTSVAELQKWNPDITNPNLINKGQVLNMPVPGKEPPFDPANDREVDDQARGVLPGQPGTTPDAHDPQDGQDIPSGQSTPGQKSDAGDGVGAGEDGSGAEPQSLSADAEALRGRVRNFGHDATRNDAASGQVAGLVFDGEDHQTSDIGDLLLKPADQLTDAEVTDLGREYWRRPGNDPLRGDIDEKRRDFYALTYGNEPAKHDAVGRMREPQPKRQVPETSSPLKTPSGEPVSDAASRAADQLAGHAKAFGSVDAVKALQSGLNQLAAAVEQRPHATLKIDGDFGPKTGGALKTVLATKGAGAVENAFALGRVGNFARAAQGRGHAQGLGGMLADATEPLLAPKPKPEAKAPTLGQTPAAKPAPSTEADGIFAARPKTTAAGVMQETLNDLGAKTAERPQGFAPLKIDDDAGPKTEDAFHIVNAFQGPDKIAQAFGENFGLFGSMG